jgi:hypothetical protein
MLLNFTGSLTWRDLGIITTADTPQMSGSNEIDVFQEQNDKEMAGDLVNIGGLSKVHEFRAVRKDLTKDVIPLLRAKRPDFGEVYPIAAVRKGFGYLIICGMHNKAAPEFERTSIMIDKFCDWLYKK